jgi:hypothetical protein
MYRRHISANFEYLVSTITIPRPARKSRQMDTVGQSGRSALINPRFIVSGAISKQVALPLS